MTRKPKLEADLDPQGTRHTRPGAKIADAALAAAKAPRKRKPTPGGSAPTRPGSSAAARAVEASKGKPRRSK